MRFFAIAQNDRKKVQNDRKKVQNDRKKAQKDTFIVIPRRKPNGLKIMN